MTDDRAAERSVVIAHFDPDGHVAPHVRRLIAAVRPHCHALIIVSTAPLTEESRAWLSAQGELLTRPNIGHDFSSYRAGLERIAEGQGQIVLINDSAVFPLVDIADIFTAMSSRSADFWGITPGYGFDPHVQSYFLAFEQSTLESPAWTEFWETVDEDAARAEIIERSEVGLSRILTAAGLRADTVFRPSYLQRLRGSARAHSSDLRRAMQEHRWHNVAGWARRLPRRAREPEWNAAVALADTALRHPASLPMVKLSTLRDDAYSLGTPALLTALERAQPDAFAGVREFLERTDRFYGERWRATHSAPAALGMLRYRTR